LGVLWRHGSRIARGSTKSIANHGFIPKKSPLFLLFIPSSLYLRIKFDILNGECKMHPSMRIFYIAVSFILLLTAQAKAQTHLNPLPDPEDRVIKYYPNPAVSQINFDFQKSYDKSYTLEIFNFIGKKIFESQNLEPKNLVNVSDYFRGIYIFQLRDANGKVIESGKFQVIR
jgi:hypothetical protein